MRSSSIQSSLIPRRPDQSEPRLTTNHPFSKLVEVTKWGVDPIQRAPHSLGAASVASTTTRTRSTPIKRDEPCFITKSSSYAHEKVHWVNAVRNNATLKREIEESFIRLCIVPRGFSLNDATNLTNLDRGLHVMLDKYALFAVTCSQTTLDQLIDLVERENAILQTEFDKRLSYTRRLLVTPPVINARYELVALHPNHLLPDGNVLTLYDRANGQVSFKTYVASPDHTLRESPGTDDTFPRFPSFALDPNRPADQLLNPFLVILNAEIKFRRYRLLLNSPVPLPADVMELIRKTVKLVELIYWQPSVRPNTDAALHRDRMLVDLVEDVDNVVPEPVETGHDEEEEEEGKSTEQESNYGYGRAPPGVDATLAERIDYGQYLISGHDFELDSDDEELIRELERGPNVAGMNFRHAVLDWQHAIHQ